MNIFENNNYQVKLGKHLFELGMISAEQLYRESQSVSNPKPYYIIVRDSRKAILASTILSHRFKTIEAASAFCREIASGSYPISKLHEDHMEEWKNLELKKLKKAATEFDSFLGKLQDMGIDVQAIPQILSSYEQLMDETRRFLHDDLRINDYLKKHPSPPKNNKLSFGEWLDATQIDVDVCLVDADTGEHYLDAVCYLEPEDIDEEFDYSPFEKWLRSLPMDHTMKESYGATLCVLTTDYSCDQIQFLLGRVEDGFENPRWHYLNRRADMADAGFEERLDFLQKGTSFEHLFDGTCLDAENEQDRKELCNFITEHDRVCVCPTKDENLFVVYSVDLAEKEKPIFSDCSVLARSTDPGKGLVSTLDGKILLAKQQDTNLNQSTTIEPCIDANRL